MHWIYLIHKFHNLSWITEINELFHDILIYWDAPVLPQKWVHTSYGIHDFSLTSNISLYIFFTVDFKKHSENFIIYYYEQQSYEVSNTLILRFWTIKEASKQRTKSVESCRWKLCAVVARIYLQLPLHPVRDVSPTFSDHLLTVSRFRECRCCSFVGFVSALSLFPFPLHGKLCRFAKSSCFTAEIRASQWTLFGNRRVSSVWSWGTSRLRRITDHDRPSSVLFYRVKNSSPPEKDYCCLVKWYAFRLLPCWVYP